MKYREITFAKGYNKPFAEFKKEFENTHVFKKLPPNEREKELKKAHKIATQGNGNTIRTTGKGKKPQQSEDK